MSIRTAVEFSRRHGPWNPDAKILENLISTLKTQERSDEPLLSDGYRDYSPIEAIAEVTSGTPFGRELYWAHYRLMQVDKK